MNGYGCTGSGVPGQCQCPYCDSLNRRAAEKEDLYRTYRRYMENGEYTKGYPDYGYDPYRKTIPTYGESDRLRREIDLLRDDVRRLNALVEKLISVFLPGETKVP